MPAHYYRAGEKKGNKHIVLSAKSYHWHLIDFLKKSQWSVQEIAFYSSAFQELHCPGIAQLPSNKIT